MNAMGEIQGAWDDLGETIKAEEAAEQAPAQQDEREAVHVVLDESEVEEESPPAPPETAAEASALETPTQAQAMPDVPLREMPQQAPVPYEQAARHYYVQSMVHALKRNGVEVADDGANLAEKEREAYERDPKGYMDIRDWARENARTQAEHYRQNAIEPYRQRAEENRVIGFLNRFQRECPDVVSLLDDMKAAQAKLFERWPELAEEPRLAVPILYQAAKEAKLRSVSPQARPTAPRLESGGARTSKTSAPTKRDPLKLLEPTRAPSNLAKLLDLI